VKAVDRLAVTLRPTLFGYQLIYQFEMSTPAKVGRRCGPRRRLIGGCQFSLR
jgi:hypothetical protein